MGMSASQSRMLFLTSRLADTELRAQQLSNAKIRLGTQQTEASNKYLAALSAKNVVSNGTAVSAASLTAFNSGGPQYMIVDSSGKTVVEEGGALHQCYNAAIGGYNCGSAWFFNGGQSVPGEYNAWDINPRTQDQAEATRYGNQNAVFELVKLTGVGGYSTAIRNKGYENYDEAGAALGIDGKNTWAILAKLYNFDINEVSYLSNNYQQMMQSSTQASTYKTNSNNPGVKLYDRNYDGITTVPKEQMTDSAYLQQKLASGEWKIVQVTAEGNVEKTTSQLGFSEESDDARINKASVEYTRKMNEIESVEKVYDMELKNIETEHNATQTEMESVKSVVEKNVERTFKIFS